MDVDALLANMRAANFCAVMALGLLLVWALMEYIAWAEGKATPPGQYCPLHRIPRSQCSDRHKLDE